MKFVTINKELFPTQKRKQQNKPLALAKATKIANGFLRDYTELPLQWDMLRYVELLGEMDESIEIRLHFKGEFTTVVISSVYVDDEFNIMQCGNNYGNLVY